jgi:hypothetical protein
MNNALFGLQAGGSDMDNAGLFRQDQSQNKSRIPQDAAQELTC